LLEKPPIRDACSSNKKREKVEYLELYFIIFCCSKRAKEKKRAAARET